MECDAQNPERIQCALRETQGAAMTGRIGKEVRVEPGKVPDGLPVDLLNQSKIVLSYRGENSSGCMESSLLK